MTKKIETINSKNTNQQKAKKRQHTKIKYDAKYIAYIENGDSGAVFITRDIADDINTKGKWIDVVELDFEKQRNGRNDYKYFVVELFNRREHPKYTKDMTIDDKKYLTWQVATEDIANQRDKGITGTKYLVIPKISITKPYKGNYHLIKSAWHTYKQSWVDNKDYSRACVWKDRKVYVVKQEEEWEYKIIATRKLNNKQFNFIQNNVMI